MAGVKKGRWGRFTVAAPVPTSDSRWFFLARWTAGLHSAIYRRTGGRLLGDFDGAPLLVLHTVGARSGEPRRSPVIYLQDGPNLVVVASMGGQPKNPGWYHNLRADPRAEVQIGGRRRPVTARVASAEEAARLWPRLSAMWPAWEDYQTRTDRQFPVMVLEPRV